MCLVTIRLHFNYSLGNDIWKAFTQSRSQAVMRNVKYDLECFEIFGKYN